MNRHEGLLIFSAYNLQPDKIQRDFIKFDEVQRDLAQSAVNLQGSTKFAKVHEELEGFADVILKYA